MSELQRLCRDQGILALYLFGSRAGDGLRLLQGGDVEAAGSDLDVGVAFERPADHRRFDALQVALEDLFAPLRVDLVPLHRVDALFQYAAIDGHRVFAADSTRADLFELEVMRRAAEQLPLQRQFERETFGTSTR